MNSRKYGTINIVKWVQLNSNKIYKSIPAINRYKEPVRIMTENNKRKTIYSNFSLNIDNIILF